MSKKYIYRLVLFIVVSVLMFACSPTKYVPEGQYFLNRVKVEVDTNALSSGDIKRHLRMRCNSRVLGLFRLKLGIYNLSSHKEKKKSNKWLRTVGEPPAIFDDYVAKQSMDNIKLYLKNKGYYHANMADTVIYKRNRKVNVNYFLKFGPVTKVCDFMYHDKYGYVNNSLEDTTEVMKVILSDTSGRLVHVGDPLDIENLDSERSRITKLLSQQGFYFFYKDMIQFYADTIGTSRSTDARLLMNINTTPADSNSLVKYKINRVNINLDYDPLFIMKGLESSYDTAFYLDYTVTYKNRLKIRPRLITETIQFQKGDYYDLSKVMKTYSRLQALEQFKFVNMSFKEDKTTGEKLLNCDVQLTSYKRQYYKLFIEGTNNSGNIGAGCNIQYMHRNLFKGGESITLGFWGSLRKERYENSNNDLFDTHEVGSELKFVTPQFWLPFLRMSEFRRRYAPRTTLSGSYSREHTPYYGRRIVTGKYGYSWMESDKHWRYNFDLVNLSYVKMSDVDSTFLNSLRSRYVKSAYMSHMILSSTGTITYNDQIVGSLRDYNYFRFNVKAAGNMLHLLSYFSGSGKTTGSNESYYTAFGVRYGQFMKADIEFRHGFCINQGSNVVFRAFIGCAYPYGNIKAMPFEESYYCGGSSDLRAWHARTVGPGEYKAGNSLPNNVGDIKISANLEYRFRLFWRLYGALFFDTGNVWYIHDYDEYNGTARIGHDFYKQMAVGTGAGARIDLNIFVLRFDWGVKVVDPAQDYKDRFVLIENGRWLSKTVFNLAIGYPF